MGHKKIKILVFIDSPKWSADVTCSSFISRLRPKLVFEKRSSPYRLRPTDLKFDIVYVHCTFNIRNFVAHIQRARRKKWKTKFMAGVRGHYGYARAKPYLHYFDALNTSSKLLHKIVSRDFPNKKVFLCHAGVDVHMFRRLRRREPGAPFLVGWAGNSKNPAKRVHRITRLNVKLKIADPARFHHGRRYLHSEMPKFYNSIDALVLCSVVEGCPRPPLEAAACEIPVVSTPVGAILEWLPKHWQVENMELMKARLLELEEDPALRARVGRKLRKIVTAKFRWATIIKEYERSFRGVLR